LFQIAAAAPHRAAVFRDRHPDRPSLFKGEGGKAKARFVESWALSNPLVIKGCGETGAIGSPPPIINAITDAIGNNDLSMPATPQKVWMALNTVSKKKAA
jgi:hypothetical protein